MQHIVSDTNSVVFRLSQISALLNFERSSKKKNRLPKKKKRKKKNHFERKE